MIASLLLRFGLGAAIPWLLPGLVAALLGSGGLAAWAFDLTDWKTAILLVISLGLVAQLSMTQSPWARTAIAIVVAGTCYIKGHIDGTIELEQKVQAAVTAVKTQVAAASKAEQERQEAVNKEALERAETEKGELTDERDRLKAELKTIKEEAANDTDANRDALSPAAVERLNRLRHERRPSGTNRVGGKAKSSERPKLDAPALPKAKADPGGKALPGPN